MSVGGRFAAWELDGSESEAPQGLVSWSWQLSRIGALDPAELADPDWIPAGSGELVVSSGSALGVALRQIVDFDDAEPGTQPLGVVERWIRLEVEDEEGLTDDDYAKITLINQAPTLDLGPDRRVAPGGAWWRVSTRDDDMDLRPDGDVNGDGIADPLDATPRVITLYSGLEDPDEGDAENLTLRWYVVGAMAPVLADVSTGLVHTGISPDGQSLTFEASLVPSASTFRVEVLEGDQVVAEDSVRVDVATSRWSIDRSNGSLRRLRVPILQRGLDGDLARLLATRAGRILVARQSGGAIPDLDVLGYDLSAVASRFQPVGTTNIFALSAVATEGTGWWVADVATPALHHFGAGPDLTPTVSPITDVDGDGTDDAANITGMAPIRGAGPEDLWVFLPPLAVRRSPTAVLGSVQTDAPAGARITEDGAGGFWLVWVSAGEVVVRRYDASGTLVIAESEDLGIPVSGLRSVSYDPQRNQLWGTITTALDGFTFLRRSSGEYALSDFNGSTSHVDVADGSLVVFGQGKLRRFTADFVPANDLILDKTLSGFAVVDGSIFVHGIDTSTSPPFPQFATWIEGGREDLGLEIPSAYVDAVSAVAVDPANGSAWVWDKGLGRLREIGADGAELRVVDFDGTTGPAPGVDVALGIDPGPPEGPRRVWIAWSDDVDGGLQYFDLTDDRSIDVSVTATSFTGPTRIHAVAPIMEGGGVCIGGEVVGETGPPFDTGWIFHPSTGATTRLSFPTADPSMVVADTPRQACWFVPHHQSVSTAESKFVPVDGSTPTTFSTTIAGQTRALTGGVIDHWYNGISGSQGRMFVLSRTSFQAGNPTRFLQIYEPTLSMNLEVGPTLDFTTYEGPFDEAESVAYDPFYRQFILGLGDLGLSAAVPPTVYWIGASTDSSQTAEVGALYSPAIVAP